MKPHRTIRFIDDKEDVDQDYINACVKLARSSTDEENFRRFMQHQATLFALQGIDIYNLQVSKRIYYIEDEE